jgi:hypothetical protein
MLLDCTSIWYSVVYVRLSCTIPESSGVGSSELASLRKGAEAAERCGNWYWYHLGEVLLKKASRCLEGV